MVFHVGDSINGCFELAGCIGQLCNIWRIQRDKCVRGIVWQYTFVYLSWTVFNCWYYFSLAQWFSWFAGLTMLATNSLWLALAIYYTRHP